MAVFETKKHSSPKGNLPKQVLGGHLIIGKLQVFAKKCVNSQVYAKF